MKIGILTQPLSNNYGGLLQNFALQQAVLKVGHTPETIDHCSDKVSYLSSLKQNVLHKLFPDKYGAMRYQPSAKETAVIGHNTQYFIDKYIAHTAAFSTPRKLHDFVMKGNYDGFVVGSDQCWRPMYNEVFLKDMFLGFVDGDKTKKKIAYAASFGTDKWEFTPDMTAECTKLAKEFDIITVREDSGVHLCKEYLHVDAEYVLDPTMLLLKEDYINLVEQENEPISKGNLFYYILDPSKQKSDLIERVANEMELTPFTVLPRCQAENRTKSDVKRHIEDCVYPAVTSWLRGFMDAKMVIVDSFHGMVFSIIFNKPFWVIENGRRGNTRFDSLLNLCNLTDRLKSSDRVNEIDLKNEIDWSSVNNIIKEKREYSMALLEKSFN